MLYDLAISVGAKITFNAAITSVAVDENDTASVLLANGTVLHADVVVGADGYKSLVRDVVNGTEDDGVDSGHSFFT
jgi:salicylate hydroxylase